MKVTIISATDEGGAGRAGVNLYKGFLKIGIKADLVTIATLKKMRSGILTRLRRWWLVRKNINNNFTYVKDAPRGYDYFTFARTGYRGLQKLLPLKNADIINLHWISNFIDYPTFFKHIRQPVIWTLHDTSPFTGGCHYTFGCENFLNDCADCMQLGDGAKDAAASRNFKLKLDSLKTLDPQKTVVIAPSLWLKSLSENSRIFGRYRHFHIPYGIDTAIFNYQDKRLAREKLSLPDDRFIILFAGASLKEARKGFDVVLNLQQRLKDKTNLLFVAAGKAEQSYEGITALGFVSEERMAAVYGAADIFLLPSREDNLPNTMLEALCCGTPVIGFKTGGIPDAVQQGINGFLVDKDDVAGMADYVRSIVNAETSFNRQHIAAAAIEQYAPERQAQAYREVMETLLQTKIEQ